eukprot:3255761-Pleurochrysis_carterae.AAC.1
MGFTNEWPGGSAADRAMAAPNEEGQGLLNEGDEQDQKQVSVTVKEDPTSGTSSFLKYGSLAFLI